MTKSAKCKQTTSVSQSNEKAYDILDFIYRQYHLDRKPVHFRPQGNLSPSMKSACQIPLFGLVFTDELNRTTCEKCRQAVIKEITKTTPERGELK
jgi:hypothetical protein